MNRVSSYRSSFIVSSLAVFLAACSSGAPSAPPALSQVPAATQPGTSTGIPSGTTPGSATGADICALLTAGDVAQITGLAISGSEPRTSLLIANDVGCTYGQSAVLIDVVMPGGATQYDAEVNQYGSNVQPISNFGDKAFQDASDIGPDVVALFGDTEFDAFISPLQQLPANADLTSLEEALITALKGKM